MKRRRYQGERKILEGERNIIEGEREIIEEDKNILERHRKILDEETVQYVNKRSSCDSKWTVWGATLPSKGEPKL